MRISDSILINSEWTEDEWLFAAVDNPAFNFLADSAEDIYSIRDGKPFEMILEEFADADLRR